MWPWGHLAVAYLLLSGLVRWRFGRPPRGVEVVAVGLLALTPDLIDKPFSWTIHLLPNGRSLGHSLLFAVIVIGVLGYFLRSRNRPGLALAIPIGLLSHLAADGVQPFVTGDWSYLGFLWWPFVPALEYTTEPSFLAHFAAIELTPWLGFEFLLVALAVGAWLRDGRPWPPTLSPRRWMVGLGEDPQ